MRRVQTEDGTVHEFPDEATDDQVAEALTQWRREQAGGGEPQGYSDFRGGVASFVHGGTIGAADEIAGVMAGSVEGVRSAFDPAYADERRQGGGGTMRRETPAQAQQGTENALALEAWREGRAPPPAGNPFRADPQAPMIPRSAATVAIEAAQEGRLRPPPPAPAAPPQPATADNGWTGRLVEGFERGQREGEDYYRDVYAQYQEDAPLGRLNIGPISLEPTELVGGLLSPINRFLPMNTARQAAATGGGVGAAYAFNTGETWEERLDPNRLGGGAAIGALGGGALYGVLRAYNAARGGQPFQAPNGATMGQIQRELANVGMRREGIEATLEMIRRGRAPDEIVGYIESELGEFSPSQQRQAPELAREFGENPRAAEVAEAQAREQEFGPLTRGERARDPRQVQDENDMRRGQGSRQSQDILRGFDDQRAPQIAEQIMNRVATRGMRPVTEDLGASGTALADELRTQLDDMRAETARRYARAMELAEQQPVAGTDELLNNVRRVVDDEFLDVGPAVGVVERLSRQMQGPGTTYATVERARQQLNRLLGSAMRSGDNAQAYAVSRVIEELDAFSQARLTGEAQRAIAEARAYNAEMMTQFGQQTRPNLATGHQGRRDAGGAAIERVVESDMTGEQVIDAIFGAGRRPSQAALGAVRRIRERAEENIQYTNRRAESGERTPGRRRVGGRTAGQRRMDPTPAERARFGDELPRTELQSLREAFVYRVLRPLEARNQGDAIPAQTIATSFRQALYGPSREITELLFRPDEIAAMERALRHLESIAPPSGTFAPSAPGIARDATRRSVMSLAQRLLGRLPVVGDTARALGDAIDDARFTRQAREAVAPEEMPRPLPRRPRQLPEVGAGVAPAYNDGRY